MGCAWAAQGITALSRTRVVETKLVNFSVTARRGALGLVGAALRYANHKDRHFTLTSHHAPHATIPHPHTHTLLHAIVPLYARGAGLLLSHR
ncbi:hypothetical protein E2C01_098175 [Portunus trituberculatus]|uniref:Uncharacterized protein n=1 Tax=Portunus trituberculatus TaxID=210409 RepID=A0A5B7KDD0_PORTR|nr:hypothetical protein [Portunus trituberculatus]